MLAAGGLGGNYVTLTWLATYLKTVRQLSVLGTGGYLGINIFGSFLGYVISAHLSDWLGRRKTFVIMACAAAVTVAGYTLLPVEQHRSPAAWISTGILSVGHYRGDGCDLRGVVSHTRSRNGSRFFVQHRPGHWFVCSSVGGRGCGSLGLGQAMGICAACSYVFVLFACAMLPETRGRELESGVAPEARDAVGSHYSPQPVTGYS